MKEQTFTSKTSTRRSPITYTAVSYKAQGLRVPVSRLSSHSRGLGVCFLRSLQGKFAGHVLEIHS